MGAENPNPNLIPAVIKPTVGRIVLYNSPSSGIVPAIVTFVAEDGRICLTAFDHVDQEGKPDMEGSCNCGCFRAEDRTQGSGLGQWDWMHFQKDQQARLAK